MDGILHSLLKSFAHTSCGEAAHVPLLCSPLPRWCWVVDPPGPPVLSGSAGWSPGWLEMNYKSVFCEPQQHCLGASVAAHAGLRVSQHFVTASNLAQSPGFSLRFCRGQEERALHTPVFQQHSNFPAQETSRPFPHPVPLWTGQTAPSSSLSAF